MMTRSEGRGRLTSPRRCDHRQKWPLCTAPLIFQGSTPPSELSAHVVELPLLGPLRQVSGGDGGSDISLADSV